MPFSGGLDRVEHRFDLHERLIALLAQKAFERAQGRFEIRCLRGVTRNGLIELPDRGIDPTATLTVTGKVQRKLALGLLPFNGSNHRR